VVNPRLLAQIVAVAKPCQNHARDYDVRVRDIAILLIHLLTTVARLLRPGGARSLVAESLLLRQQLLILNRGRQRAPNLKLADRLIAALCCGWISSARLRRFAIVLKPATLLAFHRTLVKRKFGRCDSRGKSRKLCAPTARSRAVSLAISLPRALSAADSGLTRNSPQTTP
jgi:hypothetical protein